MTSILLIYQGQSSCALEQWLGYYMKYRLHDCTTSSTFLFKPHPPLFSHATKTFVEMHYASLSGATLLIG